jgi:metal-responsive CopG/Arc/MetJ family transcriptional regulator
VSATTPIPVRLSPDLIKRLDDVAERIGSNRAAVIRFCIQTFVEHLEKNGRMALPPNWLEIIAAMDNRTLESRVGKRAVPEVSSKTTAASAKLLKKGAASTPLKPGAK